MTGKQGDIEFEVAAGKQGEFEKQRDAMVASESASSAVSVAQWAVAISLALIVLGGVVYDVSGRKSITAATPSFVGALLMVLVVPITLVKGEPGLVTSVFSHVSVMVSIAACLLGLALGIFALKKGLPTTTVVDTLGMAIGCGAHVYMSINHFLKMGRLKTSLGMKKVA